MAYNEKTGTLLNMVLEFSEEIRKAVVPYLGNPSSKDLRGHGASGDATFSIDEIAETVAASFLGQIGDVAYYTEDRGLIVHGKPDYILIIDPIDGTRPAAAGLEACCVSVAVAPYAPGAEDSLTVGDVYIGVVNEIKNKARYLAVKGEGSVIEVNDLPVKPILSEKHSLDSIFWTLGFRGRPAEPLVTVLSELIDMSSVGGGVFDLGSATFCIAKVLTGELDLYVDVGQRIADEVEAIRRVFIRIGHGSILNNYPYDLAAAALIARESGAIVTDAYGRELDGYPLIPRQGGGQLSAVVSPNPVLHHKVMSEIEAGMDRLKEKYC
ncbi:MAG: hypothetical protein JW738_05625 [Actinobacteria bacterium]|nr:hypothetical protein [Actinomycetota bacterium]